MLSDILETSDACVAETVAGTTQLCDRYLPSIATEVSRERVVVVESALGTGKSTQIVAALSQLKPSSVLAISPRILFSYSMAATLIPAFADMRVYCDLAREERSSARFITCQVESLCTISGTFDFDVVLIDESESVLSQLTSSTNTTHFSANVRCFERFVRGAGKVIWADAFLTNRTLRAARDLGTERVHLIRNTFVPLNRTREFCGRTGSALANRLCEHEFSSKRLVVVSGSKKTVGELQTRLKSCWALVGGDSSESEEERRDRYQLLRSPNANAQLFQHLVYTSVLSVGTDITVPYDVLGLYCSPNGPCPRDLFQSMYRVRNITEKRLVYSIYPKYHGDRKQQYNPYAIRADLTARLRDRESYSFSASASSSKPWDLPEWFKDVAVHNELEANYSAHEFLAMMEYYFRRCGYSEATHYRRPPVRKSGGKSGGKSPYFAQWKVR